MKDFKNKASVILLSVLLASCGIAASADGGDAANMTVHTQMNKNDFGFFG